MLYGMWSYRIDTYTPCKKSFFTTALIQDTEGTAKQPSYPCGAAAIGLLVCDPQAVTAIFCASSALASLCLGCNVPGLMTEQLISLASVTSISFVDSHRRFLLQCMQVSYHYTFIPSWAKSHLSLYACKFAIDAQAPVCRSSPMPSGHTSVFGFYWKDRCKKGHFSHGDGKERRFVCSPGRYGWAPPVPHRGAEPIRGSWVETLGHAATVGCEPPCSHATGEEGVSTHLSPLGSHRGVSLQLPVW